MEPITQLGATPINMTTLNTAMKLLSNLLENTPNIVAIGRTTSAHGAPEIEVVFLAGTQIEPGRIPPKILQIPITVRYLTKPPDYPTQEPMTDEQP